MAITKKKVQDAKNAFLNENIRVRDYAKNTLKITNITEIMELINLVREDIGVDAFRKHLQSITPHHPNNGKHIISRVYRQLENMKLTLSKLKLTQEEKDDTISKLNLIIDEINK